MKKTRRGRPKGRKSLCVRAGISFQENLGRAMEGNLHGKDAVRFAGRLWSVTHPAACEDMKAGKWVRVTEEEAVKHWPGWDAAIQDSFRLFSEEAHRRILAGDGQFFKDLGKSIARRSSGRFPDDKFHTVLAGIADFPELYGAPLSVNEFLKELKKAGISKQRRAVIRALNLLGITYEHGKPGRKPTARRPVKRRRPISMAELRRSVATGFKHVTDSRPEMAKGRRKSGHFR